MRLQITINTDNAAFSDNPKEMREVLEQAARKIEAETCDYIITLLDSNGNSCGYVEVLS